MSKRRKRQKPRPHFFKHISQEERRALREAAFAAIKKLYAACLPLWRHCRRGACRRHKICAGGDGCLKRAWPLLTEEVQDAAFHQVMAGGPRRIPPATAVERELRHFPPSNFVH